MSARPLFGGALEAVIDGRFIDVSQFREVPDNQELMVCAEKDESIIVELLERQQDVDDAEIAHFHFEQLAKANDALGEHSSIENVRTLSNDDVPHFKNEHYKCLLRGTQSVSKFKEKARNTVQIYLIVIRLPEVSTDLLVTVNAPLHIDAASSSARSADAPATTSDTERDVNALLRSIKINDWGLFG